MSALPIVETDNSPRFDLWSHAEAQRWRAVLIDAENDSLALLSEHGPDAMLHERIETQLGRCVRWQRCSASQIDALLQAGAASFRALDGMDAGFSDGAGQDDAQELSALNLAGQESPVVRLLDATLHDALQDGASDLHFECTARGMLIRCRIDGVMSRVREVDGLAVAEQLVSRLKVMAELDIGERRLPQDGRFKLRAQGREVDFRLSIMPSVFGEDAVVRVLDRAQARESGGGLTLRSLGFGEHECESIRALARQPHGMLLVTGPTGSGKTTTLYAAIQEINTGDDKIITIEDPVEYQLPGVVQIPVNDRKGLSFARGLRSILRHDPDRVMVGEIRDPETAQIAVQAALTGHLVFSTVHANNALDVIGRFMHMGLDLYNVVSALNAVMAQRLLRLVCTHCRVPAIVPHARLLAAGAAENEHRHAFARGEGCTHCRGTGYKGRRAIAELLVMNDELRELIAQRAPMSRIRLAARANGFVSLRQAAIDVALRGETTLDEVDRVTLDD